MENQIKDGSSANKQVKTENKKSLSILSFTIPTKIVVAFTNLVLIGCTIALVVGFINDMVDTVGRDAFVTTLYVVAPFVFFCLIIQLLVKIEQHTDK